VIAGLRELSGRAARSIVKPASQAAMSIVNKAAKQNAKDLYSDDKNTISKAIGIKTKTYKRSGTVVVVVGPRAEKINAEGHRPSNTAHLIELGTEPHTIRSRTKGGGLLSNINTADENIQVFGSEVQHPGIAPQPFLRPALDDNERKATTKFNQVARKKLNDVTKMVARNHK
jgi:HK97 gp10 family phage protein